jgi:anti-sigma factor RsiW
MNDPVCDRIRLSAMARLDGEAAAAGPEEVAAHLQRCADCARDLAEMEALGGLLRGKVRRQEPADLWAGLASGLDAPPTQEGRPWRWPVLASAAILLLGCRLLDLQPGLGIQLAAKLLALGAAGLLLAGVWRSLLDLPARFQTAAPL